MSKKGLLENAIATAIMVGAFTGGGYTTSDDIEEVNQNNKAKPNTDNIGEQKKDD